MDEIQALRTALQEATADRDAARKALANMTTNYQNARDVVALREGDIRRQDENIRSLRAELVAAKAAGGFTVEEVREALNDRLSSWITSEVMQHLALKKGTPTS